jgi:hypothetical protein
VDHEERGPEPDLGSSGAEHGIQVLPHEVAEERVRQDRLEPGSRLEPHRPRRGVVKHEQAAAAGLLTHTELAHGGEGESLRGKAPGVGRENDVDVDAGFLPYPLQILVVVPLLRGRDQADPILQPPGRTAEPWP